MLFGTILKMNKSGDVLVDKDFARLVPEFIEILKDKNLGSSMMMWIINVYDYNSPYRYLPLEVRQEDMAEKFFGKKNHPRLGHAKVKKAIKLYEYVQYDEIRHQYEVMKSKHHQRLKEYEKMTIDKENLITSMNMDDKMLAAGEKLAKLKDRLKEHEEEKEMMGEGNSDISFIEEQLVKYREEEI